MPLIKQVSATIETPDPSQAGTFAWTNPANIRDSGNPPVLDGTDATSATASATPAKPVYTIRFHPTTQTAAGLYWVGLGIDWQITAFTSGPESISAYVKDRANA